jgi:hypothetical protein
VNGSTASPAYSPDSYTVTGPRSSVSPAVFESWTEANGLGGWSPARWSSRRVAGTRAEQTGTRAAWPRATDTGAGTT